MPDRPFQKARLRLLDQIVLLLRIEHVDLYRQRSPEHVEKGADDLLAGFGRGRGEEPREPRQGVPALGLRER